MSNNSSQPPAVTQYDNKRYKPFYLTMLVLSTIGTLIGLISSCINIPVVLQYFSTAPAYTFAAVTTIVLSFGSAVAIVFLWLKWPFGIWLKLSAYVLSIIVIAVMALTIEPVIQANLQQALERSSPTLSAETTNTILHVSTYVGLGLNALVNIVFGILWYFAWKRQQRADSE